MRELKELIRQYPELGEAFADWETRLLCLENSLPLGFPEEPTPASKDESPWNKRQWDTIQQLKAQVLFLSSKVNEMRASASKRRKDTI